MENTSSINVEISKIVEIGAWLVSLQCEDRYVQLRAWRSIAWRVVKTALAVQRRIFGCFEPDRMYRLHHIHNFLLEITVRDHIKIVADETFRLLLQRDGLKVLEY